MNIRDIQNALIESADLVALAVCRRNAPKSDMMTRRKLYESYPNDWLDYHIKRKNIQGIKAGAAKNSAILFSRLEVEAPLKAEKIDGQDWNESAPKPVMFMIGVFEGRVFCGFGA